MRKSVSGRELNVIGIDSPIVGAALVPVFAWLFGEPCETIGFGCLAAFFVIYRHKENIQRLLAGTESKIKAAKR